MKLAQITALPKQLVLAAIACYRLTRFFRTPSCRFYPSCSKYMSGCVQKHGLVRGLLLTLVRLSKCHPLHPGGVDEIPDRLPPGCNHGDLVVENISDDLNRAIA